MKPLLAIIITPILLFSSSIDKKTINDNDTFLINTLDKIETNLEYIHKKLNSSSKYLDEFITNDKSQKVYYGSYIRIENSIEKKESKSIEFEPNIDIRIYLPKLKEKLSLTIDNNENRINQQYEDSNENTNYTDNDYNIGLLYNTIKKDINLKFKLGVKASTSPYIYAKAEAKKVFEINSKNNITIEEKIKYSNRYKLDNYTSLQYKYNINKTIDLFNHNEYYINSDIKNDNLYNSLRLYQVLNDKKYLNYVTSIKSNDYESNFQIKEYRSYISYRSYIRKWLYYDLVPSISWERDNDFNKKLAFRFNLGILISK